MVTPLVTPFPVPPSPLPLPPFPIPKCFGYPPSNIHRKKTIALVSSPNGFWSLETTESSEKERKGRLKGREGRGREERPNHHLKKSPSRYTIFRNAFFGNHENIRGQLSKQCGNCAHFEGKGRGRGSSVENARILNGCDQEGMT